MVITSNKQDDLSNAHTIIYPTLKNPIEGTDSLQFDIEQQSLVWPEIPSSTVESTWVIQMSFNATFVG